MNALPSAAAPDAPSADCFCCTGTSPTPTSSTPSSPSETSATAISSAGRHPADLPPAVRGIARVSVDLDDGRAVVDVPYELTGNADGPLVAMLGGISATRHVASNGLDATPGWWSGQAGNGAAVDTPRYRVLSFDYVGGPDAPLAHNTSIATSGQASALAGVLDALDLPALDLLIGASYGGMVGLAFAARYPEALQRLLVISAAHRAHPMATALRVVQQRIVRFALDHDDPERGLRLARALAMTTYRTALEFEERFEAAPFAGRTVRFPVEDYLDARSDAFARTFDAHGFLALSASIDHHRVDPTAIVTPTDIVAVDSDDVVPPWLARELRDRLGGPSTYLEIRSRVGHDAFLVDVAPIAESVCRSLVATSVGAASAHLSDGPYHRSPGAGIVATHVPEAQIVARHATSPAVPVSTEVAR